MNIFQHQEPGILIFEIPVKLCYDIIQKPGNITKINEIKLHIYTTLYNSINI